MTTDFHSQRPRGPHHAPDRTGPAGGPGGSPPRESAGGGSGGSPPRTPRESLLAMLEARSVALVGASKRDGSFGARMLAEVAKSAASPAIYPVNPRYADIGGRPCYPSLAALPEPAHLAMPTAPYAVLWHLLPPPAP